MVDNRDIFLSKLARHRFAGYAYSQLKRVKGHKVWIDNPPPKPEPEKYLKKLETNMFDIPKEYTKNGGYYFDKDAYENAKKKYEQYEHWKQNRNKERAELEEKYKVDTKHCVHLFRLMRMGIEIQR